MKESFIQESIPDFVRKIYELLEVRYYWLREMHTQILFVGERMESRLPSRMHKHWQINYCPVYSTKTLWDHLYVNWICMASKKYVNREMNMSSISDINILWKAICKLIVIKIVTNLYQTQEERIYRKRVIRSERNQNYLLEIQHIRIWDVEQAMLSTSLTTIFKRECKFNEVFTFPAYRTNQWSTTLTIIPKTGRQHS